MSKKKTVVKPKKKTVVKNKVVNAEEFEDPSVPVDFEKVQTSMIIDKNVLSEFRIRSAEEGRSMASIMRDFIDGYLESDEEARENVEDYLPEILESCGGIFGGFKISKFINQMSDKEIDFSHLNAREWRQVLVKLEDSGLNGAENAREYRDKFSELSPSRKQRNDLRKLGRKLLKKEKDDIW